MRTRRTRCQTRARPTDRCCNDSRTGSETRWVACDDGGADPALCSRRGPPSAASIGRSVGLVAVNVWIFASPRPVPVSAPVPMLRLGDALPAAEPLRGVVAVGLAPRAGLIALVTVLTAGAAGNPLDAVAAPLAPASRVPLTLVDRTPAPITSGPLGSLPAVALSVASEVLCGVSGAALSIAPVLVVDVTAAASVLLLIGPAMLLTPTAAAAVLLPIGFSVPVSSPVVLLSTVGIPGTGGRSTAASPVR